MKKLVLALAGGMLVAATFFGCAGVINNPGPVRHLTIIQSSDDGAVIDSVRVSGHVSSRDAARLADRAKMARELRRVPGEKTDINIDIRENRPAATASTSPAETKQERYERIKKGLIETFVHEHGRLASIKELEQIRKEAKKQAGL